ncbi:MAG: hypothetical protein ACR2QE_06240 [Acidimicrobiales bacterium]
MGKASSSKKVARAARAGQSSGPSERRELGFPIAIAAIVILGVLLVGWARTQRESEAPTLRDHWHSAYGVFVCTDGEFLEPFTSENDPDGIHSHQDGLIHIHPFGSSVTGDEAQMDVFLEAMLVSLDDDQMILADGTVLSEADTVCDGEAAVWQVARWSSALDVSGDPDEIITEDLAAIRFDADGEAFTIALVPLGADIPPPPTASEVAEASQSLQSEGPVTDLGDDTGGSGNTDTDTDLSPDTDPTPDTSPATTVAGDATDG